MGFIIRGLRIWWCGWGGGVGIDDIRVGSIWCWVRIDVVLVERSTGGGYIHEICISEEAEEVFEGFESLGDGVVEGVDKLLVVVVGCGGEEGCFGVGRLEVG